MAILSTNKMTYHLLEKAPKDHSSDEFINFLRDNNPVVFEDGLFLIIENCKYHRLPYVVWHTVFFKCKHFPHCSCASGAFDYLNDEYGEWEWLKKAANKQTVKRFHIHLIKR